MAQETRVSLECCFEAVEKRKDAQLAREVVVALPHEVSGEKRLALVRGFAKAAFVDRGMIADIAIHAPGKEGDERNHHAHIMLTTRSVDAEGFGGKDRSWNSKALLEEWREDWAEHVNGYLRELEAVPEVDHRSLEAQRDEKLALKDQAHADGDDKAAREFAIEAVALNRDPLPDIGWKAWGMERRGVETIAGDLWRAAHERLDEVKAIVADLRERFREVVAEVKERGEQVFAGLRERLQGADLSKVQAANEAVEEVQKAEAEKDLQSKIEEVKTLGRGRSKGWGRER